MKLKVLVIEDNDLLRENTVDILELAGYCALSAEDGKEGIKLAQQESPDLILCDILMPKLDGYGVLQTIENIPDLKGVPFVFLTSKSERADFRKGMDLGADDYLTKPFDADELLRVVGSRLRKREIIREKFQNSDETIIPHATETIQEIIESQRAKKYNSDEIIFHEDDVPAYFYYIKNGKVKTYKTNNFGKNYILNIYCEGDFFGFTALLNQSGFSYTAETLESSEISLIPKRVFFELLYDNREVSEKFIKMISSSLQDTEKKLIDLAFNSARKKVADALVYFYLKYNDDPSIQSDKTFHVSREDISSIAGVVPESVSRNLSDFRNENLIETQRGKIKILDINALRNIRN